MKRIFLIVAVSLAALCWPCMAGTTFTPDSFGGPFCLSPAFGPAVCSLTTEYINGGVLFSNTAVFPDPPDAFGGINNDNNVDLLAPVLGSIVVLGTTDPGTTDSVSVLAGGAAAGTLRLDVYDINHILLGSSFNPSDGSSWFGVNAAGIRYFSVWTPGSDSFGVDSITLGDVAGVPEPGSFVFLLGGLAFIGHKLARR